MFFKNWFWQTTVKVKTSQTKNVSHAFVEKLNNVNSKS